MRFLHAADLHLGNMQYNHPERYVDFYRAFRKVAELAVEQQVDVCLIAGDLFHKASIDPQTLLQAEDCLRTMTQAGIKVLAVAGNHDRVRYKDGQYSWLDYLAENGWLTLLSPQLQDNAECLMAGQSYVDLDGVRFIGVPYYGSSTALVLEQVWRELPLLPQDGICCTVLIAHAAIEGQLPDVPSYLRFSEINPLRESVQHIALGHLHKPFVVNDWIHNPGAIEYCDFDEARFEEKGGVFIVDVTADGGTLARKYPITGRPFYTLTFAVDPYSEPAALTIALRDHVLQESRKWSVTELTPVVRVKLHGNLAFDRTALDLESLRQALEREAGCLILKFVMQATPFQIQGDFDQELELDRLEREVFEELARQDIRFSNRAEAWGAFMRETKEMALDDLPPEQVYDALMVQTQQNAGA